jgi:hypothetical protein
VPGVAVLELGVAAIVRLRYLNVGHAARPRHKDESGVHWNKRR